MTDFSKNRVKAIYESLNDRLERDHKKHINLVCGIKEVDGIRHMVFKFSCIDRPESWNYMNGLVTDYCESLTEIKRTKTTLVVMV